MKIMKKNLFLAALAIVALASCTNDEFVGDNSPDTSQKTEDYAISFGSISKGQTRADYVGKDAATKLNNKFIVSAFKGNGTNMTVAFPDYIVSYGAYTGIGGENTAGKTQSNTSDWDYVGITAEAPSAIEGNKQTIKFWDYSTTQYDFIAYSTSDATVITDGVPSTTNVKVTQISPKTGDDYAPTYAFSGSKEPLSKCYIADMVTAYKEDKTPTQPKYQQEVMFKFRNLASKVRVALYETVPGYSVKDVKFYTDATTGTETGATSTDATLFTTGTNAQDYFYTRGKMTVTFPTTGEANLDKTDYNKAHVSFDASDDGKETTQSFGTLNKVGKEASEKDATDYLGRTLPTASFAGTADPWYTTVLPNEVGTVLELRVDYTLLATDGSGEEITVHGATAFVPAIYATWLPNYAYTYIFKISDNTNGWTDPAGTGPTGLYPITFDAVVLETEDNTQSTITTVSTPSITTYQKGHVYTNDEYDATKGDIYIMAMDNDATPSIPKSDIGTAGYLYAITNVEGNSTAKDEANVMDALNIKVSEESGVTTGRNGLILTRTSLYIASTIPGPDGNDITPAANTALKFTPAAGKTYAFCYLIEDKADTYLYSAETLTTSPSDWSTENTWYKDPNGVTPAGTFPDGGGTFYKKYKNDNKVYAVKVIKVVE